MEDRDLAYKYMQHLNDQNEGFSNTPYLDSKGNPTVGHGLNLNSPETAQRIRMVAGIEPNDLLSGAAKITPEQSDAVRRSNFDATTDKLQNLKDANFPSAELNPAQHAALADMHYENHNLIGPQLQDKLNKNDVHGAIKEILLNSNAGDEPGEQKRRLAQAAMFGGPVDFNMAIKNMSKDERDQIRDTLDKMKNPNELNRVYQQYPVLDPTKEYAPAQASFYKIPKLFGE